MYAVIRRYTFTGQGMTELIKENGIAAEWVRVNMPASIQFSASETTEGEVVLSS